MGVFIKLMEGEEKMNGKLERMYLGARWRMKETSKEAWQKFADFMRDDSGEFMDVAIKILISIVIGALILAGLYALWNNIIMPRVEKETTDMFDYTA